MHPVPAILAAAPAALALTAIPAPAALPIPAAPVPALAAAPTVALRTRKKTLLTRTAGRALNVIIALRFLLELETFVQHYIAENIVACRSAVERNRIATAELALLFRIFIFHRNKSPSLLFCHIDKHSLLRSPALQA